MATEVLPPAPNAAQLGKFGGLTPGLFSGAAKQQISLYTIKTRDLEVPISLSYSSNGVKVDEVASHAGTNWVLNFGGVINRTAYDVPDEFGTFVAPPNGFDSLTPALFNYLNTAVNNDYSGQDTQPDMFTFNFNGEAGKFILDAQKIPVLLDKSNLKIEPNFTGLSWNFKITTGNGDQYFFGGSQATESSKTYSGGGPSCGKSYGSPIPTAWYLNKIKSVKGDSIVFKYTATNEFYSASVNESMTRTAPTGAGIWSCQPPGCTSGCGSTGGTCVVINDDKICSTSLSVQGVALSEVDFDQGKITIDNIARGDVQGDILVGNINIYSNTKTSLLKQFTLGYVYSNSGLNYISNSYIGSNEKSRPFLQSINEKDLNGVVAQKYKFSYEDINGLPPRLSFAQDHYGYFNGKNNTIFIPVADDPYIKSYFPASMGNRTPDSLYARKGLLTKIIYPTGGSDSLVYEPHKGMIQVTIPPTVKDISTNATGTGTRTGVTTSVTSSTILKVAPSTLTLYCDGLAGPGTYDTVHQFAEAEVDDAATGARVLYLKALPFENKTGAVNLSAGHSYILKVTAYGSVIGGSADLSYSDGNPTYQSVLGQFGGMRVAKVITFDPVQNNTQVKRFYYGDLNNLNNSSANNIIDGDNVLYYKGYRTITQCETFCTYTQGSSSSMYNLFVYSDENVVYNSVIEGLGNNFENGGVEHIYSVHADVPAHTTMGNDTKGAPLSNAGWDNGREINTNYFKKNGTNFNYTRKIYNHYKLDSRGSESHYGYVISSEYDRQHTPLEERDFDRFDVSQYNLDSHWVYKDTTRTTEYDAAQNLIASHLEVDRYDNPVHFNLTRNQITKSTGQLITTLITYPQDYTSTNTFITNLINNHVLDVPIETVKYQQNADGSNTNILSGVLRTYKTDGKGLLDSVYGAKIIAAIPLASFKFSNAATGVLPISGTTGAYIKSSTYEPRLNSVSYDGFGNLTQQHIQNGLNISYKWGYNGNYPIARISNAAPNEFYSEGYEESTASGVTTGTGHTGIKYTTNATVSWSKPNSRNYVITYWYRSGGVWKLQTEQAYTGPTFTMSGGDAYDDVRIYPADAQLTTLTFDPIIGATSSTDSKGETTYFEYDSFLRLLNTKDKDRNILKSYDYNYRP
ncbi:hypothetical protein [Mucilaginibacter sp. 22184]|uniref:hypothetical protein n=1 Tax=Mucilaginibacter sp. 22184 TaxID=3453887 RepID=UPI003F873137